MLEARFWAKVNKTDSCWLWTGAKTRDGYGSFNVRMLGGPINGTFKSQLAHRVAYADHYGHMPEGPLDHLCRTRSCVRFDHLEPVSHQENMERAYPDGHRCRRGHEPNWYYKKVRTPGSGRKQCRTCLTESNRRYRRRRAEARA